MRNILSIRFILLCLIALYVIGCATISSPQGGPKDSIPPRVKNITPPQYSVNFSGKRVEIEFNEYVQLKDQSTLFFVSPQMEKKPTVSAKNKKIIVDFQDTLLPNQTYRLDFGASIVDNNEGNRLTDFTITFSTGDKIDSLFMVGQVVDAQTRDTIVGAFIPFFAKEQDSTFVERGLDSTLVKSKAEGLFRTDSSGYFIADILKGKDYRTYTLLDYNGNQLYEAGTDYVAYSEEIFNPLSLPDFAFGYDSTAKRMYIDPLQVVFEIFLENPPRRQRIKEKLRPQRGEFLFVFDTENAVIDSLVFDSIPSEWIIEERSAKGDSLTFWIAPPSKIEFDSIRDTLSVAYVYFEDDSVFQAYSIRDTVKLNYKDPEPELTEAEKDKLKEKEAQEKRQAKADQKEANKQEKENRKGKGKKGKRGEDTADTQERGQGDPEGGMPPRDSSMMPSDAPLKDSILRDSLSMGVTDSLMLADSTLTDSLEVKKPVNPFAYKIEAEKELNPEKDVIFTFGYPLRKIDSTGIKLVQTTVEQVKGARRGQEASEKKITDTIDFSLTREGLRRLRLSTDWIYGAEYEIIVRDSVFEDIAWRANDSITSSFKILDPEKFATLVVALESPELDSTILADYDTSMSYIVEIVTIDPKLTTRGAAEESGKNSQTVVASKSFVKPGDEAKFQFLKPQNYYFRITADRNGDGLWTTGSMRERYAPEDVRLITNSNGQPKYIEGKENWEIVETVNPYKLFPANKEQPPRATDIVNLRKPALDSLALDSLALDSLALDSLALDSLALDSLAVDTLTLDTLTLDSLAVDSLTKASISLRVNEEELSELEPSEEKENTETDETNATNEALETKEESAEEKPEEESKQNTQGTKPEEEQQ
ncbi:MAG: Ig-like domain-containing protein [Rikenellaceae bacterium]